MVRSPGMYFLAFHFFLFWESCIWKVEASGEIFKCYHYNSETGGWGDTHSCERYDKDKQDMPHCQKDLDKLFSEVNEIIKMKLMKDLGVGQSRMSSVKNKLTARALERYSWDHSYPYPNDRYACATIAIKVKFKIADNKEGRNEREVEHSVELRGIYWGEFDSEYAKNKLAGKCNNNAAHDYGVFVKKENNGEEVIIGKGQIFFCPCFDQDECNSNNDHWVPHLESDKLGDGKPRLYKGFLADMGVDEGDDEESSSTEEGDGHNAQPRITGSGLTLTIATFLIHLLQN